MWSNGQSSDGQSPSISVLTTVQYDANASYISPHDFHHQQHFSNGSTVRYPGYQTVTQQASTSDANGGYAIGTGTPSQPVYHNQRTTAVATAIASATAVAYDQTVGYPSNYPVGMYPRSGAPVVYRPSQPVRCCEISVR